MMFALALVAAQPSTPEAVPLPRAPQQIATPQVMPSRAPGPGPAEHRIPIGLDPELAARWREAYAVFDSCRIQHADGMALVEAEQQVIHVRTSRAFWEQEIARSESLRQRVPGGYPALLAQAFDEYRRRGGRAARAEEVEPSVPPCIDPSATLPRGPSPLRRTLVAPAPAPTTR